MSAPPMLFTLLAAASLAAPGAALRPLQAASPVGCFRFDRPLGQSATGVRERADSSWYAIRLLPKGAVARPELASAYRRELYARRSNWTFSHDTLRVRVFTGLAGWDLVLTPRDSGFAGVARYLSDAVGGSPFSARVHARREACRPDRLPDEHRRS